MDNIVVPCFFDSQCMCYVSRDRKQLQSNQSKSNWTLKAAKNQTELNPNLKLTSSSAIATP